MTTIQQFIDDAKVLIPDLHVSIDEPDNPQGIFWLDVQAEDFTAAVSWNAVKGFGFYTDGVIYGERPDEIYKKPAMAARRLQQLYLSRHDGPSDQIVPLLRQLRALVDLPQTAVAEKLDIQQAAISRLENRGDIKLSSLLAYMKALDIQLEIKAHNADFEMSVPLQALQNAAGKELN